MGMGQFEVTRRSADQLEIALVGELTERTVVSCDAEVRAQLSASKPAGVAVLIDLSRVTGYSLEARDALVGLQRSLAAKARQSAYLADGAPSRSLSLWVRHTTAAQALHVFNDMADALAWLSGTPGPTTGVRPVARARRLTPTARRNKIAG
jgi:hypothetical protein